MGFFFSERPPELEAPPVDTMPVDPNEDLVTELRAKYPFTNEAFNMRSLIRVAVWVNMQMREK